MKRWPRIIINCQIRWIRLTNGQTKRNDLNFVPELEIHKHTASICNAENAPCNTKNNKILNWTLDINSNLCAGFFSIEICYCTLWLYSKCHCFRSLQKMLARLRGVRHAVIIINKPDKMKEQIGLSLHISIKKRVWTMDCFYIRWLNYNRYSILKLSVGVRICQVDYIE